MPIRPPTHRVPWHKPREQREAERKARLDAQRPGSTARGYDHAWRAVRKAYLAQHPICSEPGCFAQATDVDHITRLSDRPDLKRQWWNLRAYCHRHHSRRTAREQGFAAKRPRDDGA
jgi:5-methylcytosine-specific restriction endonuclease McrA